MTDRVWRGGAGGLEDTRRGDEEVLEWLVGDKEGRRKGGEGVRGGGGPGRRGGRSCQTDEFDQLESKILGEEVQMELF